MREGLCGLMLDIILHGGGVALKIGVDTVAEEEGTGVDVVGGRRWCVYE